VIELRGAALAEAVDVDDRAQRVEAIGNRDFGGFPDRPFRRLAVAHQHVGAIVRLDPPRVQRNADAGAQSLTQ
jgi:hypothetical protein